MKVPLGKAFGLITAALTVLGVLKSLLSIGTGDEWSLQKLAFYIGNAAIFVYVSVVAGALLAGLVTVVIGEEKLQKTDAALWVWGLTAFALAILLVLAGAGYGYDDLDAFGTAFMSFLGLAAVGGGVAAWRFFSKPDAQPVE
ncbi:hypothetical protein [Tessaracoccus antarcticus]|uniref:Uncharacterized protein n=1 Tax=Tessaracoccus antarcticus TaxID=2479848 RepID=A0A3M0G9Z3_9ACTN|nr:hypothetical protein [Tessaracoccus antarcticus]RMB61770.1 hypothetical protein EAX62_03880 [Tessaracoccus antarcticus]